jgi:glutamyl-tRNA reductase
MNNEKTMTIFKTEKDKKEFVAAFRKLTMSGAITRDAAIEKIMRNNPHYFHQPSADELKKISHSAMNDEMRARAQQTNKFADSFFSKGKE